MMIENEELAYYVNQVYNDNLNEIYLDNNYNLTDDKDLNKTIIINKQFIDEYLDDYIFEIETSPEYAVMNDEDKDYYFVTKLEEFIDNERNFWDLI